MTCHAVPGSPPPSSQATSQPKRSPTRFTHPHPPPPLGGSLLIPLAPHPLPHRSALMSGKNKTASPTARTEFHPPLRRRTTACIGKKGSRESETGEGKRDSSVGRRGSKGLGGGREGKRRRKRGVVKREGKKGRKRGTKERGREREKVGFQEVRR